jgi:2,3-bisphosphoglycerate-dependent phosphoglycerate mutase
MSLSELVLVRHGQSQHNEERRFGGHGPSALTPLGERQAEAVAAALAREHETHPVVAIYASDLRRAADTAAPTAQRLGIAPVITPALRERAVGELTGLTFEEVEARYPEMYEALVRGALHVQPPGGESHRMCADRAALFLAEVIAAHPEGRVLVFAHGVVIEHLLRHVLGVADEDAMRCRILTSNCGMHRIERRAHHFRVHKLNDTEHLIGIGV